MYELFDFLFCLRWSLKHDRDPLLTNAIRRGKSQALAELTEASSTRPDLEKTSWSRDLQVFSKLVESDFSVSGRGIYSVPPRTAGLWFEPKTAKCTSFFYAELPPEDLFFTLNYPQRMYFFKWESCRGPREMCRPPDPWRHRLAGQSNASKRHLIIMSTFVDVPEIKLIRTDTTLDLSQKAEKVCFF
mgnify:CR=1 FL=1